nr:DNA alkylation repair protein [Candidatus Njordarchaeum guaymaensis]
MAEMAVHHEDEKDSVFFRFLRITQREATDARNYVIKAVGWALRQIGKRNLRLNEKAINVAKTIAKKDPVRQDGSHSRRLENYRGRKS